MELFVFRARGAFIITAFMLFALLPSLSWSAHTENTVWIALKYVALRPTEDAPAIPSRQQAQTLAEEMSKLWAQCRIGFVLEDYSSPVASEMGVPFNPSGATDRRKIRRVFSDSRRAVYVATGKWDRSRDPFDDGSNAFSTIPGAGPQGIVFEDKVARSPRLLAHEFGHLAGGLDDLKGSVNLMNHFVSTKTTLLEEWQCASVRKYIVTKHSDWIRVPTGGSAATLQALSD